MAREEVLNRRSDCVLDSLMNPKADYSFSRSNLRHNTVRKVTNSRPEMNPTFSAVPLADFVGSRVQSEDLEGSSKYRRDGVRQHQIRLADTRPTLLYAPRSD